MHGAVEDQHLLHLLEGHFLRARKIVEGAKNGVERALADRKTLAVLTEAESHPVGLSSALYLGVETLEHQDGHIREEFLG